MDIFKKYLHSEIIFFIIAIEYCMMGKAIHFIACYNYLMGKVFFNNIQIGKWEFVFFRDYEIKNIKFTESLYQF